MYLHPANYRYYGVQLWFPEYFKRLQRIENCTGNISHSGVPNCTESLEFYQDSLYTALASLPGNILGVILIAIIGGRIQTGRVYTLCTFL